MCNRPSFIKHACFRWLQFDNGSNGENRAKFKIEHLETGKEKFYDEKLFTLKGRKSVCVKVD